MRQTSPSTVVQSPSPSLGRGEPKIHYLVWGDEFRKAALVVVVLPCIRGNFRRGQELAGKDDRCLSIKLPGSPRSQAPLSLHKLLNCSANLFGHFKKRKMTLGFQLLYVKPGMGFRKNLLGREIF